mmetsp:Transcript_12804/g.20711  ORF Transcript_12804/g.20711 Transcript_12804/m.20711 type:complete len:204 (+) Transcript_12804:265-876(+)
MLSWLLLEAILVAGCLCVGKSVRGGTNGGSNGHKLVSNSFLCGNVSIKYDPMNRDVVVDDNDGLRNNRRFPKVLRDNVSIDGHILMNDYHFYQICILPKNITLHIDVVMDSRAGNADLYLSFSQLWPTVATSDMNSAKILTDRFSFPTDNDFVQKTLRDQIVDGEHLSAEIYPQAIYLSVFGKTTSNYTIKANIREKTKRKST